MKEHMRTRAFLCSQPSHRMQARTEQQRGPKGVLVVLLACPADSKPQVGHLGILGWVGHQTVVHIQVVSKACLPPSGLTPLSCDRRNNSITRAGTHLFPFHRQDAEAQLKLCSSSWANPVSVTIDQFQGGKAGCHPLKYRSIEWVGVDSTMDSRTVGPKPVTWSASPLTRTSTEVWRMPIFLFFPHFPPWKHRTKRYFQISKDHHHLGIAWGSSMQLSGEAVSLYQAPGFV